MSRFVESLKRLYAKDRVSEEQLTKLVETEKLTEDEVKYIKGE